MRQRPPRSRRKSASAPDLVVRARRARRVISAPFRGLGDTLVTRALLDALGYRDRLAGVPLEPPLHETFAFIRRRNARLSPATRVLMTLTQHHLEALAHRPR